MKQVEIYIGRDGLNGTTTTLCLVCGDSMLRVEFHMVLTGIIGERSRKLHGKKTTGSG